ncbi:hypothetical protein DL762_000370 [Monosporascus cannonballus]|uniref:Uncharacterized protein n=1 Tax=Monosporascus cannonballus TaxID=155416 RepID=A0ABY0HJK6_9PEZI|nr:hypothetical protein DL762_000370 [Monosporascus cannonballus]
MAGQQSVEAQIRNIEAEAEKKADEWLRDTKTIPLDIGYNWKPLLTALATRGVTVDPPADDPEGDAPEDDGPAAPAPDHGYIKEPKNIPVKDPKSGSWKYTWYVPQWSHPNHSDRLRVTYDQRRYLRGTTDTVTVLRPALLPGDKIRNPTPYAKRFGVHPDDLNGRSRLSPTLSSTRNPLEDYVTQIDMLSEAERTEAIAETRQRGGRSADPNYIDPKVLDEIFEKAGIQTGQRLRGELRTSLEKQGDGLEQVVDRVGEKFPKVKEANRNFFRNTLEEQDYQRLLFQEYTTDELIQGKIHLISDEYTSDLDGPIHPLLARDKWETSEWKGGEYKFPRFLYNLDGERKEWDMRTNDELWEAMQPALQLASRVLRSNHPHFAAIADMRTRQILPDSEDFRDGDEAETPYLLKYVPFGQIDLSKCLEGVRKLHHMGYDWHANVSRILSQVFRLDICSVFWNPVTAEVQEGVTYGWTYRLAGLGDRTTITSTVGAEVIWPLLSKEYSRAEKLSVSFLVADIILHEFAHAINISHQLLCEIWAQPPDQPWQVTNELVMLWSECWDSNAWAGEHPFSGWAEAELGNDVETAVWGFTMGSLIGDDLGGISQDLEANSLIVKGISWPWPNTGQDRLLGYSYPAEDYGLAIPVDHIAKFFTKKFWAVDFARYGHEALRQFPDDRHHRLLMRSKWSHRAISINHYGQYEREFLVRLTWLLKKNGYPILGTYIGELYHESFRRKFLTFKWTQDLKYWCRSEFGCPLDSRIRRANVRFRQAELLDSIVTGQQNIKAYQYQQYLARRNQKIINGEVMTGPAQDMNAWLASCHREWAKHFTDGGGRMRLLSEIHRLMQKDIAFLQRMILDYLSVDSNVRGTLYRGGGMDDRSPIGVAYGRMLGFMGIALDMAERARNVGHMPQFSALQNAYEEWSARFRADAKMYRDLIDMLASELEFRADDWKWKATLQTIPSSLWRKRSDRLKLLAHQQYLKADKRIRDALDRASAILNTSDNNIFPPPADVDQIDQLIAEMQLENQQRINGANGEKQASQAGPNTAFRLPARLQGAQQGDTLMSDDSIWDRVDEDVEDDNTMVDVTTALSNTAANPPAPVIPGANDVAFGVPATPVGPGRTPLPGRPQWQVGSATAATAAAAAQAPSSSRSSQAGPVSLGVRGAGVQRNNARERTATPFGRYTNPTRNIRSFESAGPKGKNKSIEFGNSAPIISGLETKFPQVLPGRTTQRPGIRPFEHPYADESFVTSDLAVYRRQQRIAADIRRINQIANPFSTSEPYREIGVSNGSSPSPTPSPQRRPRPSASPSPKK